MLTKISCYTMVFHLLLKDDMKGSEPEWANQNKSHHISYHLTTFLAFLPQSCNQGTLQGQMCMIKGRKPHQKCWFIGFLCALGTTSQLHSDSNYCNHSLNFTCHKPSRNAMLSWLKYGWSNLNLFTSYRTNKILLKHYECPVIAHVQIHCCRRSEML